MGEPKGKGNSSKVTKVDSDTSESVYETDNESDGNEDKRPRESSNSQQEDEDEEDEGIAVLIERFLDWWRKYWQQRFFRQIVRSSVIFLIGMKLLKELKGLEIIPNDVVPPCPNS